MDFRTGAKVFRVTVDSKLEYVDIFDHIMKIAWEHGKRISACDNHGPHGVEPKSFDIQMIPGEIDMLSSIRANSLADELQRKSDGKYKVLSVVVN